MLHVKSNAPAQGQRTRIEDLAVVGDVLSEEQLRGVAGGATVEIGTVKCSTATYSGYQCSTDTYVDFTTSGGGPW